MNIGLCVMKFFLRVITVVPLKIQLYNYTFFEKKSFYLNSAEREKKSLELYNKQPIYLF